MSSSTPAGSGQAAERAALARRALDFARERLGPASARRLEDPAILALVLSRLRAGTGLEDAVLAEMHAAAGADRELADEFFAHFLGDLLRLGRGRLGAPARRMLDTGDLVQSVLGDLWRDLLALRFESRDAFLALAAERLRWKASDKGRGATAGKRREDLRAAVDPGDLGAAQAGGSPPSLAGTREDQLRLETVLRELPERDARLLRWALDGRDTAAIAAAEGLSVEAARKAVQRARARARELAARGGTDE